MTTPREPYRVIQWGTGAVGTEMITAILDHRADLDLVGVKVYSEAKHGRDVGTIVGRDPVGVHATADTAEVIAMPADCVLYTPRTTNLDEVCAILASGKNLATTAFMFHPRRLPAPDRDRLLAACEQGSSSVHGSGLNPGNLSGVMPLALSGMSRTIDKITLQERADWSVYESTGITFDNMAFGRPVEEISPATNDFLAFNSSIFTEQVWFLADALNAGIDVVTATVEASPPTRTTRSSTMCCTRVRRRDNGGTGSAVATANRSSRSRRCGPLAASIPITGRARRTAGR